MNSQHYLKSLWPISDSAADKTVMAFYMLRLRYFKYFKFVFLFYLFPSKWHQKNIEQ